MEHRLSFFRRVARWLGPALTVLLLGIVLIGGVHHHGALDSHHACALCTAAHAPAVGTNPAPAPSASLAVASPIGSPASEPRVRFAVRGIASRAPPTA